MSEQNEKPRFQTWTITKLEDVQNVPQHFIEKVLHFLNHAVRKCYVQTPALVTMRFHEHGQRISYVMRDLETGAEIREPKEEIDPLE